MPWSVALGLRAILAATGQSFATGSDTIWVLMTVEAELIRAQNSLSLSPETAVDHRDRRAAGRLSTVPWRQQGEPVTSLA